MTAKKAATQIDAQWSDVDFMWTLLKQHDQAIWWAVALSTLIFVGSLFIVPWLVVRIPEDYFAVPRRPTLPFSNQHPVLRWTLVILKNIVGILLFAAGLTMLVLPGQGLLTVVVGTLLLDFPGKHHLERKIVRMPPVLKSINWLRQRADVQPLRLDTPATNLDSSPTSASAIENRGNR